ncbi:MAG: hypothetical protein BWK80_52350 [Desulfobacteraceae bacterium IS3]|nr:MAG: hypothetical protein BWK80_52350 [Desulfobacteraceae bacterium IS3]
MSAIPILKEREDRIWQKGDTPFNLPRPCRINQPESLRILRLPRGLVSDCGRVSSGSLTHRMRGLYLGYSRCIVFGSGTSLSAMMCRRLAKEKNIPVLPVNSEGFKGTKKDGCKVAGYVGMLNFAKEVYESVTSPVWKFARNLTPCPPSMKGKWEKRELPPGLICYPECFRRRNCVI